MGQWQTEVLGAFPSTVSFVLVFKEERNSQEWQRSKSSITWELLTWTRLQEDRTHLLGQRSGWHSSASPWHLQHRQVSALPWKGLKAQHGKVQAGQHSLSWVLERALKTLQEAISGFQDPKGHFLPEFHVLLWAEAEAGHLTKSLPTLTIPWFYIFCKGKG